MSLAITTSSGSSATSGPAVTLSDASDPSGIAKYTIANVAAPTEPSVRSGGPWAKWTVTIAITAPINTTGAARGYQAERRARA